MSQRQQAYARVETSSGILLIEFLFSAACPPPNLKPRGSPAWYAIPLVCKNV